MYEGHALQSQKPAAREPSHNVECTVCVMRPDGADLDLYVAANVIPPTPMRTNCRNDDAYPGDPGEVELLWARDEAGRDWLEDLDTAQHERICEAAMVAFADWQHEDRMGRAESIWEARRERGSL